MKKSKMKANNAHTARTKYGMGDFYGSGIKNPIGRLREDTVNFAAVKPKYLKKPPKSFA
jgi:hypothetical protein